MDISKFIFIIIAGLILTTGLNAQDSTGAKGNINHKNPNFVDKNNDGYNDNAPDHDGDGIPNGLDPDWQKLQKQKRKGQRHKFIDLDGDGIDDNVQNQQQQGQNQQRNMEGQKDGSSLEAGQQNGQQGQGQKRKGKRK
ncbi:MAG: hypothetical protein P8X42_06945 [Calditrichaceae bacterium]|jgi:hypothetical protein